jgi:XTP/dITP diphosphohydrolase
MIKICFATNNKNKLFEVKRAVPENFEIVSLEEIGCFEELPETTDTLEGNSLQKAQFVLEHYYVPCFADDTGLEVEALGGAPGVYSARYAGLQRDNNDNIELLLKNLSGINNRRAQFRTVITLTGLDDRPIAFEGIVGGEITLEKSGTQGFGYDPVFRPEGFSKTFADMTIEEKNQLSHRAIAVRKLTSYLLRRTP